MHNLGDAVCGLFNTMIILLIICIPLAVWKIIDILIWVFSHVYFELK